MAADLRFRLVEPLQLVARRNEKSSAELSRFLAKQVSGAWEVVRGSAAVPGRPPFLPPCLSPSRWVLQGPPWVEGDARRCLCPLPPRAAISCR